MQEQVEHVVRLVDDLMDVSRIMSGKIELRQETVELSTIMKRAVLAAKPAIENQKQILTVALPNQPVWLNADLIRLVQVLENLLNNSSKYTPPGGKIDLKVKLTDGLAIVEVRDDGVGMEQEFLPQVFELFAQASRSLDRAQGGLGIGQTLVKKLVELHNGSVSAYSAGAGLGSTFTICLPVVPLPGPCGESDAPVRTLKKRKVLIVDDNRSSRWLLSKLLGKLGDHEVVLAEDGASALEKIGESRPDIVILDIGLPGMDGCEVCRRIRADSGLDDVLLIAMTGYGREEDRVMSKDAGFDEHLVKPPSVDQIKYVLSHPKLS